MSFKEDTWGSHLLWLRGKDTILSDFLMHLFDLDMVVSCCSAVRGGMSGLGQPSTQTTFIRLYDFVSHLRAHSKTLGVI